MTFVFEERISFKKKRDNREVSGKIISDNMSLYFTNVV